MEKLSRRFRGVGRKAGRCTWRPLGPRGAKSTPRISAASTPNYLLSYEVGFNTWISQTTARAIGTLSVLMRDATNDRRVWLGFVRMQIDMSLTAEQRNERLRQNIRRMLEKFPPSQPRG